jgi:hypothetical protein
MPVDPPDLNIMGAFRRSTIVFLEMLHSPKNLQNPRIDD